MLSELTRKRRMIAMFRLVLSVDVSPVCLSLGYTLYSTFPRPLTDREGSRTEKPNRTVEPAKLPLADARQAP